MKIKKLLIAGILTFVGLLGFSSADYELNNKFYYFSGDTTYITLNFTSNTTYYFDSYPDSCFVGISSTPNYPVRISVDGENWVTSNSLYTLVCGNFYYKSTKTFSYNKVRLIPGINYTRTNNIYSGIDLEYFKINNEYVKLKTGYNDLNSIYGQEFTCFIHTVLNTMKPFSAWSVPGVRKIGDFGYFSDNDHFEFVCSDNLFIYVTGTDYIEKFFSILFTGVDNRLYGGGGSDPFVSPVDGGIFDFNSFLIEKAVLCYMSSGTYGGIYGDCMGINYSGFINQYDPNFSSWQTEPYYGTLSFDNAKPILENYCLNTDSIEYPFCSQLDIYENADLLYVYENNILNFYALGSGFGIDFGSLGSGQLGELTCTGVWCNGNVNEGLPDYIITGSSNIEGNFGFSGNYLSSEFFNDFVSSGFFFRCPFPYEGSYFTLGKQLINYLGGHDLLIPLNCFIAGYSAGIQTSFFGDPDHGRFRSGSLIHGEGPGFERLYLLFDIILSFGLVFFFVKMFNFLFGHS